MDLALNYKSFFPNIKSIKSLLTELNPTLGQLIKTAQQISELDNAICDYLPTQLKPHVRVGEFTQGNLLLFTTNSAFATQIRYQIPELLERLRKDQRWQGIRSINVKIHPDGYNWHKQELVKQPAPKEPLDAKYHPPKKLLENLSQEFNAPEHKALKASIEKLLKK